MRSSCGCFRGLLRAADPVSTGRCGTSRARPRPACLDWRYAAASVQHLTSHDSRRHTPLLAAHGSRVALRPRRAVPQADTPTRPLVQDRSARRRRTPSSARRRSLLVHPQPRERGGRSQRPMERGAFRRPISTPRSQARGYCATIDAVDGSTRLLAPGGELSFDDGRSSTSGSVPTTRRLEADRFEIAEQLGWRSRRSRVPIASGALFSKVHQASRAPRVGLWPRRSGPTAASGGCAPSLPPMRSSARCPAEPARCAARSRRESRGRQPRRLAPTRPSSDLRRRRGENRQNWRARRTSGCSARRQAGVTRVLCARRAPRDSARKTVVLLVNGDG